MQSQDLTTQETFEKIAEMIKEKPELFQVFTELCERAFQVIDNNQ